jgi:hypothetical protein
VCVCVCACVCMCVCVCACVCVCVCVCVRPFWTPSLPFPIKQQVTTLTHPSRPRPLHGRLQGLFGSTNDTDAAFLELLASARPPARRLVGLDAWVVKGMVSWLPEPLLELILSVSSVPTVSSPRQED